MARKKRRRAHGMGSVYERSPGNWWVQWTENGRRRHSHGYETRELAEQVRAKIVAELAAGRAGLAVAKPIGDTIGALADAWLTRRMKTHRSANDERWRWGKHLAPTFDKLQPIEVDAALLRKFIEAKLGEELSSSTVRLCILELSSLFTDLVERGLAPANPVRSLPRSTRRLIRPAHDPRTTPFLEKLEDVLRLYVTLIEPVNIGFAIGSMGGLRTGEIQGLRWPNVDLKARRIHVRESRGGPLKDDESRVVPILDPLLPVLSAWRKKTAGDDGLVMPPMHGDGAYLDEHTLRAHLRGAMDHLEIAPVSWYRATRHTFASHWVINGGSLESLKEILGHSTVQVTERYAHLRPDLFGPKMLSTIPLELPPSEGGAVGYAVATRVKKDEEEEL